MSLGDTLAGIRGGHWIGYHGSNLPRAYDKLGFFLDPARSPSMEVGDTVCRSRIRKYGCSTIYFICRGANGEPLQGNHTPNDSNFPTKSTDNYSFHGGVFNFSGGKGLNIQEDLEDYFNFAFGEWTIAFWIRFTSTTVQYFWDGRNGDTGKPNWMLWNYNPGGGSTTDTYHINVGNEKTKWNFSDNSGFVGGSGISWASANTPLNKWMHVLYAQDDDEHRLAINGKVVNQGQGGLDINGNMNKNFRLGCRYNTTNQFTGYYGPVAMWNVSVNQEDILQTYKAQRNRFGHDQIMINVKWAGDNPSSAVRARVYRYFGTGEDYLLTDNQQFQDGHDYISCNDPDLQSGDKLKIQFYNITQFHLDATGNSDGGGDLSSSALQVNGDVSWYAQTASPMEIVMIVTDAEPKISLVVGFDNQAPGGGSGGN